MALAGRGEEGFRAVADPKKHIPPNWQDDWQVPEKTLYRLAFLSDRHACAGGELKMASHCGGIKPYPPWLHHCKGTSMCADPGNPSYGEIVKRLFSECFPWRHNDIVVTTAEELWEYDMKTEEELIHYRFECLKQLTLTTPTRLSRSCPGPPKICKEEFGELATSPLRLSLIHI